MEFLAENDARRMHGGCTEETAQVLKSNLNRKPSESDSFLLVVRFSWVDLHIVVRKLTVWPQAPPRLELILDYQSGQAAVTGPDLT